MMAIVGSRATMLYYNDLRTAGAQVRKVLLMNAAEKWGVDAASLRTEPGAVVNPANGQKLSYGEIAAFGKIPSPLPTVDAKELKAKKDWRLIGKGVARRDTPAKVNGSAVYGIDVRLPGMVYATTLHSPVHNTAPESWNDADIKKLPGVIATVKLPNGIAVVADRFERALAAKNAIKATWQKGKAAGFNSEQALEKDYEKVHHDPSAPTTTVQAAGDAKAAFAGAAKVHKAEFRSDFGYHAQMEPLNAVARVSDAGDRVEIWEGTQAPDISRTAVAKAFGLKEEQVAHNQCYLGGGFGRRNGGYEAVEAALIAREVKRPVKLVWTREEDLAQGRFRPQSFQCLEAATDASGKVTGWKHCVVGDDGGFALLTGGMRIPYYGVPNQHLELRGCRTACRSSTGVRSPMCSTSSPSKASSTRWRSTRTWTRSRSGWSVWPPRPRHASASRPWRRCAIGTPSGQTAAHSACRSPSARARSAPAWSKSRSTGRPARSRSTRCGSRSTAARW